MQEKLKSILLQAIDRSSKSAVATDLGLSRPTIDAILSGSPPNLVTVETICDKLGYELEICERKPAETLPTTDK